MAAICVISISKIAVLIDITFSGMVYGFSNLSAVSFINWQVGGAILMGLIAMVLLIIRSLHLETPILDFRLFTNHRFAGHVLIFFLTIFLTAHLSFCIFSFVLESKDKVANEVMCALEEPFE